MELSNRNWLVRIEFFRSYVPTQVSLCTLFWRIVRTLSILAILLFVVVMFAFLAISDPWTFAKSVGITALGLVVLMLLVTAPDIAHHVVNGGGLVAESIHAFKNRFCPIIRIKHD